MSDTVLLLLALAVPVALAAFFLFFGTKKKAVLTKKEAVQLLHEIDRLDSKSPTERLVGYDKVLDHLLSRLGYRGTLGQKLKREPKPIRGKIDEIWRLHKIRNKIVHELEPVSQIDMHADRYRKILLELLTQG